MSDILNTAKWFVAHGISVIPVKADGSKAPMLTGWRKYSSELADDRTLAEWFGGSHLVGIGVTAGPASGNLVILDFECVGGESAYLEWLARLPDATRAALERFPTSITPSGGRHVWLRLDDPQPGGKLARYANGKTKIEVRGDGHQVLAPGCPAECHKSGQLYRWQTPPEDGPNAFPLIDADTLNDLVENCFACNEYQPQEQPRDYSAAGAPAGKDSPGNDFNQRGTWAETGLFDAGWTWAKQVGPDRGLITRPGKDTGVSASIGMVSSKETGYPYLYVWSTSTDFTSEATYSRFAVYAHLKHQGNYSEAAKELARLGYGERLEMSAKGHVNLSGFSMKLNTPDGNPVFPFKENERPKMIDGDPRPFKWMSELSAQAEDATWIWKGYLARSGITLLSALWKSGKSTLLSHLLKSLDGSQTHFLGQEVSPARVLYVTEEAENIWARRRDNLLIGNHVGMACRPFKMRPTMQQWKEYLQVLSEQIHKHQFDLVVFDTLSKMWPVREENDAGQVEEALQPLWKITDQNTAILLVHHTRKSGGEQFVSARGSGGLPAFVEIILEFGRQQGNPNKSQRLISGVGRYEQTPENVLIELTPTGYVAHGDPDDPKVKVAHKKLECEDEIDAGLSCGEWMTVDELNDRIATVVRGNGQKVNNNVIIAVLKKRIDGGEVERDGEGKKGNPYRYRATQMTSDSVLTP